MKIVQELIQLGEQLATEKAAAHDLWTWLPSHAVAKKHHGDYASEHCPSNRDVMVEAAMYLANMSRADTTMTPAEQEYFLRCPCDEDHEEAP
jgi:hypothetical protein